MSCVRAARPPAPRRPPPAPPRARARAWREPRGTDHRAQWFSAAFVLYKLLLQILFYISHIQGEGGGGEGGGGSEGGDGEGDIGVQEPRVIESRPQAPSRSVSVIGGVMGVGGGARVHSESREWIAKERIDAPPALGPPAKQHLH